MEVFFDNEGLEKSLNQFTEQELIDLRVKNNWHQDKREYFTTLNKELEKRGYSFRFDENNGTFYGKGETYFEVKKVNEWQKYIIEKAEGSLIYTLETPEEKIETLVSNFQLLETESNHIKGSLSDIYLHFTKILHPEFKQIVRLSPTEEFYHHNLVAATKIRFFPIVDIGRTIYLFREETENKLIPIGYAIYIPD